MDTNKQMQSLLDSPYTTLGYVYRHQSREVYCFEGTSENIAAFLMKFSDADQMDILLLNTIGTFIDTCPDQNLLSQILEYLVPMQIGDSKPKDFFCPTSDEVNAFCNQQETFEMTL